MTDHYAAAVRHLAAVENERTPSDTERRQNHLSAAATHATLAATAVAERQAAAAERAVEVNLRLLEAMAGPVPTVAEPEQLPDPAPRMGQQCANCPHVRGDHAENIVGNPCLGSHIARPCDCRAFTEPTRG